VTPSTFQGTETALIDVADEVGKVARICINFSNSGNRLLNPASISEMKFKNFNTNSLGFTGDIY
jgi:hypothetical protein